MLKSDNQMDFPTHILNEYKMREWVKEIDQIPNNAEAIYERYVKNKFGLGKIDKRTSKALSTDQMKKLAALTNEILALKEQIEQVES